MPNRYTRDELILVALQMAQMPNLEVHDAPNGVVREDAFMIQWLQDILDFWHHFVPFSATVKKISVNCTVNSDSISLPSDFILDVKNGLLTQAIAGDTKSYRRCMRLPLQKFINRQVYYQTTTDVKYPLFYCISGDDGNVLTQKQTMLVTPTPTIATVCQLWYYQLPPPLEANHRPRVPNDYVCTEYLRLRAHEWQGLLEPGASQKFCHAIIKNMQGSHLLNEPEDDEIPMDQNTFMRQNTVSPYHWMGPL
jgi:hypothetical protein